MSTRTTLVLLLLAAAAAPARAAAPPKEPTYPWNVPDEVRVVQSAPTDGVRTFSSIAAAIASCASTCYVKVMPGTYTENLTLLGAVVLEGSGRSVTRINGTIAYSGYSGSLVARNLTLGGDVSAWAGLTLVDVHVSGDASTSYAGELVVRDSYVVGVLGALYRADISGTTAGGISLTHYAPDGSSIRDTVVQTFDGSDVGIYVSNSTQPGTFHTRPTWLHNVRTSGFQRGLLLNQSVEVTASDCDLAGSSYGVYSAAPNGNRFRMSGGRVSGGLAALYGTSSANEAFLNGVEVAGTPFAGTWVIAKTHACTDANLDPLLLP